MSTIIEAPLEKLKRLAELQRQAQAAAADLDPVSPMLDAGMEPDQWQRDFLRSQAPERLLCITRQGGKSLVGAAAALDKATTQSNSTTLVVSPAQRQSGEVMEKVRRLLATMRTPLRTVAESSLSLRLSNNSRIIALPGKEATIRTYAADLLILDEGARILDGLYQAVRPMLAVTGGQLVAMSTPWGRQGWFWEAWSGGVGWERTMVTADQCPRISEEFLAKERATIPEIIYRTEYMCEFSDLAGAAFSAYDIEAAVEAGHLLAAV